MDAPRSARHGFTLVETLTTLGVAALATAMLGVGLDGARTSARSDTCKSNLQWQGEGYAQYAGDYRGQIATYSWRMGFTYRTPDNVQMTEDMQAAQWQQTELLRRHTGRYDGVDRILNNLLIPPQRRYNHLVLLDYLELHTPQQLEACPEDANLIASKLDPLNATLWATTSPYNEIQSFRTTQVRQRYPFSSTYQTVPYATWIDIQVNGATPVAPAVNTSHQYQIHPGFEDLLGTRNFSEVAFPSLKVHMFEHNDFHHNAGDPFYAYPQARAHQLFFDGSVAAYRTSHAEPGWDPSDPDDPDTFRYVYTPLSTEPIPLGDPNTLLPVSYRFTRNGLQGFDYKVRPTIQPASDPTPR